MERKKFFHWGVDGAVVLLLIACLWVPETQKALGRAFTWDQFRHWDASMMMPGWAYLHHQGLNADIFSPWGMGAVIFITRMSQMLGGFDYAHVLMVMMSMVILYYTALYAFLRAWLGSALLAVAVMVAAVKVQMFHSGTAPLIWIFPQDTAVRHWLDLAVLWCFWRHTQSSQRKYLLLSAAGVGLMLAWAMSVGLCLLAAFWGHLIFLSTMEEYRKSLFGSYKAIRRVILIALLPLLVTALTLFLLQGRVVFQPVFWKNCLEPLPLFFQGVDVPSFYACLYDRHFFAFIAGFAIPVIYVWTLMTAARQEKFLVPLCIYGLGMYVHYLAHATTGHYYATGLSVVMVLGWWAARVLARLPESTRPRLLFLLCSASWGALLTNIYFVYYPNVFDLSRMDWKPEAALFQNQIKFDRDAAMVDSLTPSGQEAAVISSFETAVLMQAGRKPLFYYAPLVSSSRMDSNGFFGTSLITPQRLQETINQLEKTAPQHIFIEKKLLGQWPAQYVQLFPGIVVLLRYAQEHYVPIQQGQYLMAMRRK